MKDFLFSNLDLKSVFCANECIIRNDINIQQVLIDSKKCIQDSLFIAIKGDRFDGHNFIEDAVCNGAKSIIVEYIPNGLNSFLEKNNINIFFVKNTLDALADLAMYNRNRLKAKVIAITGNIGKTSTRNIVSNVISVFFKTISTSGNLNNHIGMPLTLVNVREDAEIVVLELGMNHLGEIRYLTKIAKPDISIITNIVPVHMEFMKTIDNIVQAKAEIFEGMNENGIVILNKSNQYFSKLKELAKKFKIKNILSIGYDDCDICVKNINYLPDFKIEYDVCFSGRKNTIHCITSGFAKHNALNMLFGFAVADILNLDMENVKQVIQKIEPVNGRGNMNKYSINNHKIFLINDAYNSSPEALCDGLRGFAEFCKINNNLKPILIIGDMLELGSQSNEYHKNIAYFIKETLKKSNINDAIFIGNETKCIYDILKDYFDKTCWFENVDKFIKKITSLTSFEVDFCIYMKASCGMHFDKINEALSSLR